MKSNNTDVALLLVRIALGLVFLAHGATKFMDMPGTLEFFSAMHLSPFWAYIVATVEAVGGLSMLLGVATGWSGILLAIVMLGSTFLVKISHGFIGGYEFDLTLFLSAIAISLAGPGKYTLTFALKRG
ncbi:MAG TPA: DoxX family protein [Candidatus Paceibacterota bacterium]|nr:DoxX family protein [Candidatus Paceibacterota bacterium]